MPIRHTVSVMLLAAGLAAPTPVLGVDLEGVGEIVNLRRPERFEAPVLALEVRDRNLGLGGWQIARWPDRTRPFDLASVPGLAPPCSSLRVDGVGLSAALACPTSAGYDALLMIVQDVVLQAPSPLAPGSSPSISDDGARVAAVLLEGGAPVLHVMDIQRTRDMVVIGLDQPRHPVLAGAGDVVACTALVDGQRHALAIDLTSLDARIVSHGLADVDIGAISANGRRVVFKGRRDIADDFYMVDLDRRTRRNISDSRGSTTAVDLSQDGDSLVFVSSFGGATGVFTADISARKLMNRFGVMGSIGDVTMTASGRRMAYITGPTRTSLEVWDILGRESRRVTVLDEGCPQPVMSSDGLHVMALCPGTAAAASVLRAFTLPEPD